jgi:hypothetical protein
MYIQKLEKGRIRMNLVYADKNVPFEAGYHRWIRGSECIKANFEFDNIECNSYHTEHALSYAWDGSTLLILDYLLNTNNYDLYRIQAGEDPIHIDVQVTTKRCHPFTVPDELPLMDE